MAPPVSLAARSLLVPGVPGPVVAADALTRAALLGDAPREGAGQ